ncbi:CoA transferase [Pontibacter sp. E15-1]|uniref:CaiB/BaiF CoA transferase family protein n=1 Tax=Pontibacter sp. E15-1 TaxID=2919918 RepID=UPI001F4F3123|nr:CoA transferase [Pontibacter sp. E15-1]MCJ8164873.1 CoA transferase [Pontibacter sp. E15-1]
MDIFKDMLVLELASVLAGPSVGQFFAELGASVTKIENAATQGDVTRRWKISSEAPETDTPAYFCAANWGKTSLALDLAKPQDLRRLYDLVQEADILIASYKPGDAEKLRVDYETLRKLNPRLVYGHITGYGPTDARAGYDAVVQAESGYMYLNGEPGNGPLKMPVALMDILAAHQLKEGLLVALLHRARTGQGQLVQVSLLDAALSGLANQATAFLVASHAPQRLGSEHPSIVPYGAVYTTKDGKQVVLAIGDDRQFQRLCAVLAIPALAEDPRYRTNHSRVRHRAEVNEQLAARIAQQEQGAFLQALHLQHVPAGAVNTVPEAFGLPQAKRMLLHHTGAQPGLRQVAFQIEGLALASIAPPPPYTQKP